MQIVKAMGGLGNQMFAYSFGLALRGLGRKVALDTSWYDRNEAHNGWELDRVFSLDIPRCTLEQRDALGDLSPRIAARLRRKLFGPHAGHYAEEGRGYDSTYLDVPGDAYFDGFWQSPRYHEGVAREIEGAFRFRAELEGSDKELIEGFAGRCLIGVHARRGDYLTSDLLGGVCTTAYFRGALRVLLEGAANPLVLYFSDDLDWCKRELASDTEGVFVDWNRGADSWKDMRLMGYCDRLAISNSSFSWWGARLRRPGARGDRTIVAPSRWYGARHKDNTDIALPSWVRLDSRGER